MSQDALGDVLSRLRVMLAALLALNGFRGSVVLEFHIDSDERSVKLVTRIAAVL